MFYDFVPKEDEWDDNEMMRRLTNTVAYLSDICFKKCTNIQYEHQTREEDQCAKTCVNNYYTAYYELAKEASQKAGKFDNLE